MKLIGSLSSPFVRKVRVVMSEKRIEYEFVVDMPSNPDTRVPESNPLGKVPVLITDDGDRLFDSPVIAEYLDSISPVTRLIPQPARQRIQVKRWEALADGILDAAVLLVQEGRRPKDLQSDAVIGRQRAKIDRALVFAASDLGEKTWCSGETYSLADIALGCALGFLDFRFKEIDWRSGHPNLARHADKLFRLAPFEATIPK
jgi:glutathione S-transferase